MSLVAITLSILLIAALVKAILGFGEGLVAMPLLTLVIGLHTAAPLVGLIGASITTLIMLRHWRSIHLGAAWRLIASAFTGIPVGVLLLKIVPAVTITHLLGISLIGYSLYTFIQPQFLRPFHPRWVYLFGFVAGAMGSAYNMSGPAVVIYANSQHWTPAQFRGTLQSFFLPTGLMVLVGHGLSGLWTPTVFTLYGLSLPIVVATYWIGNSTSSRIPTERFSQVVRVGLFISGLILLFKP